jgi:hypothetical protein
MAAGIPIAGNPEHPPTAAQLSRLRDQWMKAPPRVAREKVIEGKRFILLELGQRVAHGELTAETPFYNMMGYDWNAFMARINEYFEPPPSGNAPRNSALEWLYPRSRSRLLAEQSMTIFTPTLSSFQETCRRAESTDRFYLIALAMLLYEREHGTLPPAWTEDEAGNRLHSWRVLLLPYLGEEELYEKILLDEPWDSEHNRRFHATTVSFYRYPGEKADAHATRCAVLVGDETAFEGAAGKKLESLGPFYYNTILVVETQQSVHWMDPSSEVDWEAAKRYLIGAMPIPTIAGSRTLGSSHRGGMHAAVSGGCVENFFDNASLKVLEQAAVGELDPSNILDEEASGPER